jgi:hypothetical protein
MPRLVSGQVSGHHRIMVIGGRLSGDLGVVVLTVGEHLVLRP